MLILHTVKEMNYTVYIGSSGDKFIFNVAPSLDPKPTGGYPDLKFICRVKGIYQVQDMKPIVEKAEAIMGRTLAENIAIADSKRK
jgi:hypothetical protein